MSQLCQRGRHRGALRFVSPSGRGPYRHCCSDAHSGNHDSRASLDAEAEGRWQVLDVETLRQIQQPARGSCHGPEPIM